MKRKGHSFRPGRSGSPQSICHGGGGAAGVRALESQGPFHSEWESALLPTLGELQGALGGRRGQGGGLRGEAWVQAHPPVSSAWCGRTGHCSSLGLLCQRVQAGTVRATSCVSADFILSVTLWERFCCHPVAVRTLKCIELRLAEATELLGGPTWGLKPHPWLCT